MKKNNRDASLCGTAFGLTAIFVSWLLLGDGSPFYDDSLVPNPIVSAWQILNIPGGFVLVAFRTLPGAIIVVFAQWFLIGFIVSRIVNRKRTTAIR